MRFFTEERYQTEVLDRIENLELDVSHASAERDRHQGDLATATARIEEMKADVMALSRAVDEARSERDTLYAIVVGMAPAIGEDVGGAVRQVVSGLRDALDVANRISRSQAMLIRDLEGEVKKAKGDTLAFLDAILENVGRTGHIIKAHTDNLRKTS